MVVVWHMYSELLFRLWGDLIVNPLVLEII